MKHYLKFRSFFLLALSLALVQSVYSTPAEVIPLWKDLPMHPELPAETVTERGTPEKPNRSISKVTVPDITVYLPDQTQYKSPTAAIIICPGGGYGGLAIDKEGHDIAKWLNTIGVTGIVLKYRMPHPEITKDQSPWPLLDAQQAIRLSRTQAKKWNIDPARIGIMGFSAGGHLASTAGTHFDNGNAAATDPIARQSCRPDFMMLGYPVITLRAPIAHTGSKKNLLGTNPDEKLIALYSNDEQVTRDTPPTFLVHAKDDGVKVANSIQFADQLKKAGVKYSLLLFEKGGHGFGMGVNGGEPATWPGKFAQWLSENNLRGVIERPS